jgi:hypothetical protein
MRMLVGALIGIGFVVAVVIGAMGQLRVKCEVCMAYDGRRTCEVARASDESHAIQQATSTACAKLSTGVTDGIRCSNTPPISTTCSD